MGKKDEKLEKEERLEKTVRTELAEIRKEEKTVEGRREKRPPMEKWSLLTTAACVFVAVILFGVSLLVFRNAVVDAAAVGLDAFNDSMTESAKERREEMGKLGYQRGFADFKTVNDVTIRVDEVRKSAKLEVMKVSSVVYIHDTGDLGDKVVAWLKVNGEGVYTVDLAAGEYVVDNANRYVLVRVPAPALEKVSVTGFEKKLFQDNTWFPFESAGVGVQLAMNQLALAENELTEDIKNNVAANTSLDSTAQTLIAALVRSLNPEVPELTVEVEFF